MNEDWMKPAPRKGWKGWNFKQMTASRESHFSRTQTDFKSPVSIRYLAPTKIQTSFVGPLAIWVLGQNLTVERWWSKPGVLAAKTASPMAHEIGVSRISMEGGLSGVGHVGDEIRGFGGAAVKM
jgi:hypothetical protein